MEQISGARRIDVLIGGAGFAGLALAIALRQALGPSFNVAVADPALARAPADARASAIVAAARRLFETIGVWDAVAGGAQPILDMVITDSRLQDAVRPTFLTFDGDVAPGEPFGHMIENAPLLAALVEKAKAEGIELIPVGVTKLQQGPSRIDVGLSDGRTMSARLLVAADGARSAIREQAGIASHGWSYDQSAIVTTVEARARSSRPCRGALPPSRAVRDPAAPGRSGRRPPLVDRLDRGQARSRAHRHAAR